MWNFDFITCVASLLIYEELNESISLLFFIGLSSFIELISGLKRSPFTLQITTFYEFM